MFDKIDADGSGSLDVEEFGAVVKKFCPDINDRQIKHLLKDADKDGNGTLDREEFIEFLNDPATAKKNEVEEESEWEKRIWAPRETYKVFADLMKRNREYHIQEYRIPRDQYHEAVRKKAEEEARIKAEAEKLAAEKAAEEAAEETKNARKAMYSSSDSEHSDNSDVNEEQIEDKDQVLLAESTSSVTSSIASMSI